MTSRFPQTPAGRLEILLDMFSPQVERDDGTIERDPAFGVIPKEDFVLLLNMPEPARRREPLKAIQAITHEGVEPDVYDDLPAEIRYATDMAKSIWCPDASRKRLIAFAEKAVALLHSLQSAPTP